jgi:hypothetical protein
MPRISPTVLRIAFWAAAALSVFMAELPQPPPMLGETGDKLQHMLAFGTMAALAAPAYPRVSLALILIGLSAFGGAIELFQMIPAISRDASWGDWAADTFAIAAVLFLVHRLRSKRQEEAPEQA